MNTIADTAPAADSFLATAWNVVTSPIRFVWNTVRIPLGAMVSLARKSPLVATAILVAAGALCFLLKSFHVGTIFISAVGVLWMWQDMLDGDAAAAVEPAAVTA